MAGTLPSHGKSAASLATPLVVPTDLQWFCIRAPLYETLKIERNTKLQFYSAISKVGAVIDARCLDCGEPSVFRLHGKGTPYVNADAFNANIYHTALLDFRCARSPDRHKMLFLFFVGAEEIIKIGQYPSVADLAEPELRKYQPVLGDEKRRELVKGYGLAAHGVGIGSFVYLRRIFENLIEQARTLAASQPGWCESALQGVRMEEKIELLKMHLPPFLVQNRSVYGILSKGIHALSEAECLTAFPVLRAGIELMLNQKLAAHEQEKKTAEANAAIQALRHEHK